MARRLETLKAYVARRSEPTLLADAAEDTSVLFIICDSCRSVGEIDDPELGRLIGHRATAARFTPRTGTIEILGLCARCRDGVPVVAKHDVTAIDHLDRDPSGASS